MCVRIKQGQSRGLPPSFVQERSIDRPGLSNNFSRHSFLSYRCSTNKNLPIHSRVLGVDITDPPRIIKYPDSSYKTTRQAVRPFAKKMYGKAAMEMSQAELYAYFLTRVRANLHIVLAFSPIGEAFRDRLRKFPSLINCCAIGETELLFIIDWSSTDRWFCPDRFGPARRIQPRSRNVIIAYIVRLLASRQRWRFHCGVGIFVLFNNAARYNAISSS